MRHLALLVCLLLPIAARAATHTSDGSQTNVQSLINGASPGDTVTVPSGAFTWTAITITNGINLQGAGGTNSRITVTGNNTVSVTKHATSTTRIYGFRFLTTSGGNNSKPILLTGAWKTAKPILFYSNQVSVASSGFLQITTPGGIVISRCSFVGGWDDSFITPKAPGDSAGSWIANSTMGSTDNGGTNNIYVEDCDFYGGTNQGIDADDGARVVFRYNICDYMSFNSHGMDTSEDGVRHWEVYNNTFRNDGVPGGDDTAAIANQNWAIWIRGGTGVIFSNTIENIANGYWGTTKSEAKFDIRAQQDNSGVAYGTVAPPTAKYSCGQGNYPRERQLGQSWDTSLTNGVGINGGVGDYITDPIWVWGNTGAGTTGGTFLGWGQSSWGSQTGYFNSGRDYVFGNTAKSNYTASTYPNVLLSGAAAPTPGRVNNLRVGTWRFQ